jgi:hypothetical protein
MYCGCFDMLDLLRAYLVKFKRDIERYGKSCRELRLRLQKLLISSFA